MKTNIAWPSGITTETFLAKYWQKKPLLMRGAFANFKEPLDPDELAGLSCEDGVESRLICRTSKKRWSVEYGPFDEGRFSTLGEKNWTILVQEVNRHVPSIATLLDRFSFAPNWRVDDVMISYATDGGGVGPHIDSYDVFLIQGRGKRRWRYHRNVTTDVAFVPNLPLRILERFVPDEDHVFETGDMLYLPAGVAHDGIAMGECTTYSIGFRAPNRAELTAAFIRRFATDEATSELYSDHPLKADAEPGEITKAARARISAMIRQVDLSDEAIDTAFGHFASVLKPGHTFEPPVRPISESSVKARLERGDTLVRSEEGRFVFIQVNKLTIDFFYGGHEERLAGSLAQIAKTVCRHRGFNAATLGKSALTKTAVSAIARWINCGALSFTRPQSK